MKKFISGIIAALLMTSVSMTVFAHSGRTDSSGGLYDRSAGSYHYHNGGGSSSSGYKTTTTPKPPVKIVAMPSNVKATSTANSITI